MSDRPEARLCQHVMLGGKICGKRYNHNRHDYWKDFDTITPNCHPFTPQCDEKKVAIGTDMPDGFRLEMDLDDPAVIDILERAGWRKPHD